tara:strand:- start:598 stop:975 length:378 start_codon:yes stop_codon:yes gene_type:complete
MKRLLCILLFIPLSFVNSCKEEKVTHGCIDSQACNYNPNAIIDNNSCEYAVEGFGCDDVFGCMDTVACNFLINATAPDSCKYLELGQDCNGDFIGCMDENACNYIAVATIDDGSCFFNEYYDGGL